MSGHSLSVKLDRDTVCLAIDCHEEPGAICRLTCPEGCETYDLLHREETSHDLVETDCTVAEWMGAECSTPECYIGDDEISLHDGMAVAVEWQGDYWGWRQIPESDSKGVTRAAAPATPDPELDAAVRERDAYKAALEAISGLDPRPTQATEISDKALSKFGLDEPQP